MAIQDLKSSYVFFNFNGGFYGHRNGSETVGDHLGHGGVWCVPHRLSHHKLKVLNFPSDKFQVFLSSRTGAFIVTFEPFFLPS